MSAENLLPDEQQRWRLEVGDSLQILAELASRSIDAIVTDPPYGIGLRGATWDGPDLRAAVKARGDAAGLFEAEMFERWTTAWAAECLRVLKPGGHLLAFGAPRMVHRLAAGVEDAGFELRDQLVWLYGSGVPKSRSYNGRSSTLKPGYEPIVLARAPFVGTLAANETRWGTGLLGIDEGRLPARDGTTNGRWPCNVTLSHQQRCASKRCTPNCPVALLDRAPRGDRPSRFFYCAKASRREREAGCDLLPAQMISIFGDSARRPRRNTHPTVKPVELMTWLVRLVCPPGGIVLDPFAGSASTGIAALDEGRRFLGIERDPDYAVIARARLTHAVDGRPVSGTPNRGSARRTSIHTLTRRNEP